jgi:hypothetical protein
MRGGELVVDHEFLRMRLFEDEISVCLLGIVGTSYLIGS